MVAYQDNDPKGWCGDPRRGAALGRHDRHAPDFEGKLVLRRVRLDVGGYDQNGTYFGARRPGRALYWYAAEDGSIDAMADAAGREDAKGKIRVRYPRARFFR